MTTRRRSGRRRRPCPDRVPGLLALLVTLGLALVTACGSGGRSGPGPPPGAPGPAPTPGSLAAFLGNGVSFWDHGSFGLDRAELLPDPGAPGGTVLRVSYPKGSASPTAARDDNATEGGTQAYLLLDRPREALTLRYQVRFPAGFQFVKGGKLPGLFGGTAGSGGEHRADGFSTRFMWRADGAGEVYAYLPEQEGYGDSLGRGSWTFPTGEWAEIAQRVELNSPGRADGTVAVTLNGSEVFRQSGLVYRSTPDLRIDGVFFSTFFGGDDSTWASPADQYADFAGFTLTEG
jgi:polysaccharide lyase-like protein